MQLLWRQRRILSPLSPSPLLRVSIKKKKSVSPHDSLAVHPSERSPTLPNSSGLCVRQIENEQQSIATVGEVSQPLKVMALASRLAGPDNAVHQVSQAQTAGWVKRNKKIRSLFLHVLVQSSDIFDVDGTFWSDVGLVTRLWLFVWLCHLCDLLTISVCDKRATWLVTVM